MEIIDRIYELLEQKNKKAYELCKVLDITQSTMSTWKSRHKNPAAEQLKPIADFFGVSLDYLITGVEAEPARYTTPQEDELLELFRSLPESKQYEYIGDLKGFLRAYADSVKYEDAQKRQLA